MQRAPYYLLILFSFFSSHSFSQKKDYTDAEKKSIALFNDFTRYVNTCIKNKKSISDTVGLKNSLYYLLADLKADSTNSDSLAGPDEIRGKKMNNVKSELTAFYRYLQERQDQKIGDNLRAIPVRVSPDKCIFEKLTSFQQKNTLVFYDVRQPEKPLGYMLIMPAIKGVNSEPRIWSWTLVFQFGKYVFQSVSGELGYEYMFSPEVYEKPKDLPRP